VIAAAAILLLHHPRKPNPQDDEDEPLTLHDLRGTGALAASARLVWAVERPIDSPSFLRVLKSNLDEKPKTVGFRVSDLGFHWSDVPKPTQEEMSAVETACAFLMRALASGLAPSDEVISRSRAEGITERNLKAARRRLGVKAIHEAKAPGRWFMTLPDRLNACTPLTAFESESKKVKEDQEVVEEQRVH